MAQQHGNSEFLTLQSNPTLTDSEPVNSMHVADAGRPLDAGSDRPPARLGFRHADAILVSLLLLASSVMLGIGFWTRHNLYRLDIITFYLPWYERLGNRLREADVPGWIPYTMAGAPFAGDPQSGWGYLPAMMIVAIAPSISGYVAFVAFHVALAATSSCFYARAIGINPLGSLAVGVVFTLRNFFYRTA